MKNFMKLIYILFLLSTTVYACSKPDKTEVPMENKTSPSTISGQQLLIEIPWIDASILPVTKGC